MRKNLTAKYIDNLRPATDRRYEVRDTYLPGFGVRVSLSGKRSWFAVGRVNDRQVRHTIGNYPTISLGEAREAARLILKDMQLGLYAPPKLHVVDAPPTLKMIIDDFIEIYAKPKNRGWKAVKATLRKFSTLDDQPIAKVTRAEVVRVLDEIVASGSPIAANRAMSAIKKVFAWGLDRGLITVHPLVGLKKPARETSRDRVLSDHELTKLWAAADDLGFPFGPALQLLLLTAQRRGEVTGMRWSHLDLRRGIWTIPSETAKNGRLHEVPLSLAASEILQNLPRFAESDLIFTTTGTTPISGFGRVKRRLDLAMSTSDWRIHDLRRTAASGMARIGVAPHVIEKVLNHVSGQISGVAAVYNRHGYEIEKRRALDDWAFSLNIPLKNGFISRDALHGSPRLANDIRSLRAIEPA